MRHITDTGYCHLIGHGIWGDASRSCPWCRIKELEEALALAQDELTAKVWIAVDLALREKNDE